MGESIQETIRSAIKPLINGYDDIPVEFHISDDLYSDELKYCENKRYLTEIRSFSPEEITRANSLNGAYIYPRDINSIQHILISSKQFDLEKSYISTAAHEVRHAINNTMFCKRYCNNSFDLLFDHQLLVYFKTWDEYSAYKFGHFVYCTITMPIYKGCSESEITHEILQNQLPLRLGELEEIINSNAHFYERITKALYIVAKFSVWKTLFNADLFQVDKRLLKAMHVFDRFQSVEELDLNEVALTLEELMREF